ncbi:MAG: hypothetical protein ACI8RD_010854 [Bacillariaceae sp.]|jgi:hypothetical protein
MSDVGNDGWYGYEGIWNVCTVKHRTFTAKAKQMHVF